MAKKRTQKQIEAELQRQSRKEILRARREAEQTRQIRLAVFGVVGLLLLVFAVALVNEFILVPERAIATVADESITMRQWRDRVRYERAQRIISLENQYEAFGGDVGIIQQFSGQMLQELLDNEGLAESVLNQMADEILIRQEAESRGITVTEADVDQEIGSFFNYLGGQSPTRVPTPTATVMPTPSLTPIPTPVITDVVPTSTPFPTATIGPTSSPAPTATPVSEESFQEQLGQVLTQFRDLGVDEEVFREVVRMQLYQERLIEALAEENEVPTEAPQASFYLLSFDSKTEADEALTQIQESDFLTVWNTIRSMSPEAAAESTTTATEILWRTQDSIAAALGEPVAELVFSLPLNVPSAPIEQVVDEENVRYHILQVSGREVRPLSEATIENSKFQLLRSLIDAKAATAVQLTELWRSRVPTQPVLDLKFFATPTPAPAVPEPDTGTSESQ